MSTVTMVDERSHRPLSELLLAELEPLFVRLRRKRVVAFCAELEARVRGRQSVGAGWETTHPTRWLQVDHAARRLLEIRSRVASSRRDLGDLEAQLDQAEGDGERTFLLRRFVQRHLGSDPRLRDDPLAARRGFDLEALQERLRLGWDQADIDQELALATIGVAIADEIAASFQVDPAGAVEHLRRFLDSGIGLGVLERFTAREHYWRFRVATFRALRGIAAAIPAEYWALVFPQSAMALIFRQCYRSEDSIWVQLAAFEALAACDPQRWLATVGDRLAEGTLRQDDDLFLRHRLCVELGRCALSERATELLAGCLLPGDISDYVRVAAVRSLAAMPLALGRVHLQRALGLYADARPDPCPQVRAACILGLLARLAPDAQVVPGVPGEEPLDVRVSRRAEPMMATGSRAELAFSEAALVRNLLRQVLRGERHELPLRALLEFLPAALVDRSDGDRLPWQPSAEAAPFLEAIDVLAGDAGVPLSMRRLAQEVRDELLVRSIPGFADAVAGLERRLASLAEGAVFRWRLPEAVPDGQAAARILAHLARKGVGLYARDRGRSLLIQKGDRFVSRLWRLWYEFHHPGPDKRYGFTHIVGRLFLGELRAHPLLLGEESPTKVPGEPYFKLDEGQWRRYLPLVDDLIDLVAWWPGRRRAQLFSAQGITVLTAPAGWWARRRAWWRLVRGYGGYARQRNIGLDDLTDKDQLHPFIAAVQELGFTVSFHPHGWLDRRRFWHPLVDPTLNRQLGLPVIDVPRFAIGIAPELTRVGVARMGVMDPEAAIAAAEAATDKADHPTEAFLVAVGDEEAATGRSDPWHSGSEPVDRAAIEALSRSASERYQATADGAIEPPSGRLHREDSERLRRASQAHIKRLHSPPVDGDPAEPDAATTERLTRGGRTRQRLIEEREERQTAEHHLSVTRQLRLRGEGVGDGPPADADDGPERDVAADGAESPPPGGGGGR